MPAVDVRSALAEYEEEQVTRQEIQAILDYGTDDLAVVARLEREMYEDLRRLDEEEEAESRFYSWLHAEGLHP